MKNVLFALFLLITSQFVCAQDGQHDSTFISGLGFNDQVNVIVPLASKKLLVGGDFTDYNGTQFKYLLRLNSDGSIDSSFSMTGTGLNGRVREIVLLPDSTLIITGDYTTLNGNSVNKLLRINQQGTLISNINLNITGGGVYSMKYDALINKLYIGGGFTHLNGIAYKHMARIKLNGVVDTNFNIGTGFTGSMGYTPVNSIQIASNGSVFIGGEFMFYNGNLANRLCKVDSFGIMDYSFVGNLGGGFNGHIHAIDIQSNGKILVGGNFTNAISDNRKYVARLNNDGTLDTTFSYVGSGLDGTVYKIALGFGGKIYVGGNFWNYNMVADKGLTRLNSDGSRDYSFNKNTGFSTSTVNVSIYEIVVMSDSNLYVGGSFNSYDSITNKNIVRIIGKGNTVLSLPTVLTNSVNYITNNSAHVFAEVTDDGNSPVTAYGICWSTSQNPTLSGSYTVSGNGINSFFSVLNTLQESTTYYVRAYATNSLGTAYGSQLSFSTHANSNYSCGNVSFNYNDSNVTYQTVKGRFGRCWLDRNLGGSQVPESFLDITNAGHLFQWGRNDDGHQLRTSVFNNVLSSSEIPGHDFFIVNDVAPFNWMTSLDNSLWTGVNAINNPCPSGYRLPTSQEFIDEMALWSVQNSQGAYASSLRLSATGLRGYLSGSIQSTNIGYYWTSDALSDGSGFAKMLVVNDSSVFFANSYRALGASVRCIKDYIDFIYPINVQNSLNILPNPSSDYFIIQSEKDALIGAELSIFNVNGSLVQSLVIQNDNQKIQIDDLQKGVFIVVVLTKNGQQIISKLIKN